MIVGFTGTREGMTEAQRKAVHNTLVELNAEQFRHGDCLGADEEAHFIARELCVPVVTHPPIEDKLRAYTMGAIMEMKPEPYHIRNKGIVNSCQALIAAPKEDHRVEGGGTWQTVRLAERAGIEVVIVWPNGSFQYISPTKPGLAWDQLCDKEEVLP